MVADVFTEAKFGFVALALLANLASVGAKALTWQAALAAVDKVEGEERVNARLSDVVPAIFIGFLMNTILFARLGEVARVSVLRRKLHARGSISRSRPPSARWSPSRSCRASRWCWC